MKLKILLLALVANLSFMIIPTNTSAQENKFQLIEYETGIQQDVNEDLHFFDNKDAVIRFREVQLSENIKSLFGVKADDEIMLNLFPDTRFKAKAQKVENYFDGNVTITARLEQFDYAFAIISTTDDRSLITIFVPEQGKRFQITSDPVTLIHYLVELNPALIPEEEHHASPVIGEPRENDIIVQTRKEHEKEPSALNPNVNEIIDIMLLYTPAAGTWGDTYGGGILNCVATAVAIGNTVHENSETYVSNRLVYTSEVSYTESGDVELDLDRLTYTTDGYMDIVHTWRNTYGADLVQLLTTMGGGIGWVLNTSAGSPSWGFSCAGIGTTTGFTPIHEMGHNMGCGHHKEQNFQPGPALFSYSAGWRWTGSNSTLYSSTMSYSDGSYFPPYYQSSTRVGYFSNPTVDFMGDATGDYTDADNAWTIYSTRDEVAGYRSTATINCIVCPGYNFEITPNSSWGTHASSVGLYGCKMYRFEVLTGNTYTFQTGCGNGATANFDTYLSLLDDNCSVISNNNDGCESNRSKITWTATYNGYAYLKVRGYSTAYGSYTLAHSRSVELVWTGTVSNNWHTPANWNLSQIPTATDNVEIPDGTPYECRVYNGNAECDNLTINPGAGMDIAGRNLYVYGNLESHGDVDLTETTSRLFIYEDAIWESGSTGSMTASATIDCEGSWYFEPGADVQFSSGYVEFSGPGTSWISNKEDNCRFNHIRNYKTEILGLAVTVQSTADIHIDGNLYNYSESILYHFSTYDFNINGFLNNMGGHFYFSAGTLVFNGNPSVALKPHTDCYLNNLVVNTTAPLTLAGDYSSNFYVYGNLSITGGSFAPGATGNFNVYVKGDWNNMVGPAGFAEAWSRVIFDGDLQYMQSNETFNLLEVACDDRLLIGDHTVVCASYDYNSGGIGVSAGTFTANDLDDPGVFGFYAVSEGGTINLHNNYVDLMGDLNIFGGTVNLYGSFSYWPYQNNASLTMTHGIIDVKECGILIEDNGLPFVDMISGGTIRTPYGFENQRTDVNLSNVTIELYGSSEADLNLAGGSSIGYLDINKGAVEGLHEVKQTDRNGNPIPHDGKANNVDLMSDVVVNNDLEILEGSLTINGNELTVLEDIFIHGTLNMTEAADIIHSGDGPYDQFYFYDGSVGNFTAGTAYIAWGLVVHEGASFTASTSNTLYFNSNIFKSGISTGEPSALFGNIIVDKPDGFFQLWNDGGETIIVDGDFTLAANNQLETKEFELLVHGTFSDSPTSETYVYQALSFDNAAGYSDSNFPKSTKGEKITDARALNGSIEIDTDFTLNGLMDLGTDGEVLVHGHFSIITGGSLVINGGSFICDEPYSGSSGWYNIYGNLELSGGIFEISQNSLRFGSTTTTDISGGMIRVGTAFTTSSAAGVFNPSGGNFEMVGAGNIYCYPGNSFYNLSINHTYATGYTVYLTDIHVQNDLLIEYYGLKPALPENPSLYIGGNWTDNSDGFDAGSGTVYFNGPNASQIRTDETFYNLVVDKSNPQYYALNLNPTKTATVLNDFTTIDGMLNMGDNSQLHVGNDVLLSEGSGVTVQGNVNIGISIGGNWTNNNLTSNSWKGFNSYTETVTFNGSENQILLSNAEREIFYNVVIDKPSGEFKPASSIDIKGDLLVQNGNWRDNDFHLTHYFEGDFTVTSSGNFLTNMLTTAVFKGSSDQLLTFDKPATVGYFHTLIIDKTDWPADFIPAKGKEQSLNSSPANNKSKSQTVTMATSVDMEFGDGLTVEEGTLLLNGNNLFTMGDVTINDGGKIIVDAGAGLFIYHDDKLSVNSGGIIEIVGEPTDKAKISRRSISGFYGFEVNSGGTILAENAIFDYMGIDFYGIHVKSGAIIGPGFNFDNCEFKNGNPAIGAGSLLTINNDQELTIYNALFPDNASADYNVAKDNPYGHLTFVDFTGDFAGEDYDWDPYNLINWHTPILEVLPLARNVSAPAGSTTFDVITTLDWTVSESVPWLTVAPTSGNGDAMLTVNYQENTNLSPRSGEITVSADGVDDVVIMVVQAPYPVHNISLPEGWSGLSSYLMPANNNIVDIFAPVADDFIIAQTMTHIYYPAGPVNTIVNWQSQSAYRVKMNMAATLPINGPEEMDKTVTASAGWSIVPVISNIPVAAVPLLGVMDLVVLKSIAGMGVYWPAMGINTIGDMQPGLAYYMLLNSGGFFTYPPNADVAANIEPTGFKTPYSPWDEIPTSSSSHLIAVINEGMDDILPGDVIGVFASDGSCYGLAEIAEQGQNTAISVFADDPTTGEKDGFESGEAFSLKLFNSMSNEEFELDAVFGQNMPNGMFFENEGLSAITQLKVSVTGINENMSSAISIYPNPTNDIVWVSGIKGFSEIAIINSTGKILQLQASNDQNEVSIDMSAFSNGIYQLKLTGIDKIVIRKIIKN